MVMEMVSALARKTKHRIKKAARKDMRVRLRSGSEQIPITALVYDRYEGAIVLSQRLN